MVVSETSNAAEQTRFGWLPRSHVGQTAAARDETSLQRSTIGGWTTDSRCLELGLERFRAIVEWSYLLADGQRGRKGSVREDHEPVAHSESVGGDSVGADKGAIGVDECESNDPVCRVYEGRWRALRRRGSLVWVLPLNALTSERVSLLAASLEPFGLDLTDELVEAKAIGRVGQVAPTGKPSEDDRLRTTTSGPIDRSLPLAKSVLLRAVDPDAGQRGALDEGWQGIRPGPVAGVIHEPFLHAMTQEVEQSSNLGFLFSGNHDQLVPTRPEGTLPGMKSPGFLGEVGLDERHEQRELLRRVRGEQ